MSTLSDEELKLVKATQVALGDAKAALAIAGKNMREMSRINREAGRMTEANAAMRLQGVVTSARGAVIQGHADASDALAQAYDDGPQIIAFGGGGGR